MRSGAFTPVAHAFHEFSKIFKAGNELAIESNLSEPYAVAATDGNMTYALISSYRKNGDSFKLEMPGKKMTVFSLSDAGFGKVREAENEISLPMSKYTVYYVEAK